MPAAVYLVVNSPTAMRALQQTTLNGPHHLRLITDAPVPVPGPGEILIRVTAAGINFVDLQQSRGSFPGGPKPPYVAGIEAAGEVIALGAGTTGIELGAHVVGVAIEGGAYAEYCVVPAAGVVAVPAGWTDDQALGLVVSWPTALAALRPLGGVGAGQTVLIHAAAGATGQAAVRIAKHYGATVIASASAHKHAVLGELGADHVVDVGAADLAGQILGLTDGVGVDLVLESIGGATFAVSLAATKRVTGRIVVFGTAGGDASITNSELIYHHQVHVIGLNIGVLMQVEPMIFGEVMAELFQLIAAGVLGSDHPTSYSLADGPQALADLEARATTGRLALLP